MKKILWWVVVLVVVIGAIIMFGPDKKPEETGPIKIGFIGPLTGDAASYGEVVKKGVEIALEEINSKGGVNGRLVEVIFEDGKCNGKDSLSAAQKLVNIDKVRFIVDGDCSGGILGSAGFLEQSKVLTLATIATNPDVSGKFGGGYILRNAQNDAARGVLMADYAKSLYKQVAVISEQTDYAQGIKNTFVGQAEKNGLKIVANEDFVSDTKDFRSILTKIKSVNPDMILINPQTGAALVRIAKQARELGIKAPFLGSEFNGPEVVDAGGATEGFVVAIAPGLSTAGKGKAYLEAFKKKYGKEPAYAYYSGAGYDAMMLFAEGITKEGENPAKVKSFLYGLKSYDGTLGNYSFDSRGDVVGINFVFQKLVNGKFVDIK